MSYKIHIVVLLLLIIFTLSLIVITLSKINANIIKLIPPNKQRVDTSIFIRKAYKDTVLIKHQKQ